MHRLLKLTTGLLLASLFGAAQALVVYDNGGPNADSGNETTKWTQAEDFTIGGGATVHAASVYIAGFGGIGAWDGTMDYFLYADAGGSPGLMLDSGAGQSIVVTDTGIAWCCGGNAFRVDFKLVDDFIADAGVTYWLGIHASVNFNRDEIYWVTTAGNGTATGHECDGCTVGPWFDNGQEHAFQLHVPEPATVALLGLGLLAMGMRRRRLA